MASDVVRVAAARLLRISLAAAPTRAAPIVGGDVAAALRRAVREAAYASAPIEFLVPLRVLTGEVEIAPTLSRNGSSLEADSRRTDVAHARAAPSLPPSALAAAAAAAQPLGTTLALWRAATPVAPIVAPRLPGKGGSAAELAVLEHRERTAAGPSAASGGLQEEMVTPILDAEAADFIDAAARGDGAALRAALARAPSAAAAAALARTEHPDHGATPLHLLVISSLAQDAELASRLAARAAAASAGGADDARAAQLPAAPAPSTAPPLPAPAPARDFQAAIALLITAGADVNARAANGATALHWAAGAGHALACRALLGAGADAGVETYTWRRAVGGRGSGQTALHHAAESNHAEALRVLLAAAPRTLGAADERGRTASALAVAECATEATALLAAAEAER
jgi:hypothetical protein